MTASHQPPSTPASHPRGPQRASAGRGTARRWVAAVTALPLVGATLAITAPSAAAASPDVVIAEVYGGGGNSGAPLRSDFVELANRGPEDVDLTGWEVQYYSASGTTAQRTALSGTVVAGGRFLIKQADGANTTLPELPAPDITGTIPMSGTGARVVLVRPGGESADLLGWGSATTFEGAPAKATTNATSVARVDVCVDTDVNAADFTVGAPTPQNSTTEPVVCEGDGGEPPVDEPETIAQIQGASHLSAYDGQRVNGVAGVVTAVSRTGFWIQSLEPDEDDATSEALLVYTRTAPTVTVGQTVTVDGVVDEFRPGGSSGWDNLTTTEIVSPVVTVTGSAELPPPVVLGEDRVAPPQSVESGDPKSVEYAEAPFRPDVDAIDFYESLEGMRVAVRDATAVGPTNSFGELPVVPGGAVQATRTAWGGVVYGGYDQPNSMRVIIDDFLTGEVLLANQGDTLPGLVTGVLDYDFGNFKLHAEQVPEVVAGPAQREIAPKKNALDLSVSAFNVENLAATNPQEKFDRLAGQVVTNLRSPDVLALEEVQDDSGPTDDGVVDSRATTDRLIAAIAAAGGPRYTAHWVNPQDKADGGQPGGNIRNVLLIREKRGISVVRRDSGDPAKEAKVLDRSIGRWIKRPVLSTSPGRIEPANPAFASSRKPLVTELSYYGETVFVATVHFSSKGGDDPLFGRWQQPVRSTEDARHEQARAVRGFVDDILAIDPAANVVVAGDVNDFDFSATTDILVGSGATAMTDLPRTLPPGERWTYVFDGNSQVLDHLLISPNLAKRPGLLGFWRRPYLYDIVHTNAAFHDQDSDHDPQVVYLNMLY